MATSTPEQPRADRRTRLSLLVAALGAMLASVCCVGPAVLLALGVGGAWIGTLGALEQFRFGFFLISGGALFLAHRRIFGHTSASQVGLSCALPAVRDYRLQFWTAVGFVGLALASPYLLNLF